MAIRIDEVETEGTEMKIIDEDEITDDETHPLHLHQQLLLLLQLVDETMEIIEDELDIHHFHQNEIQILHQLTTKKKEKYRE